LPVTGERSPPVGVADCGDVAPGGEGAFGRFQSAVLAHLSAGSHIFAGARSSRLLLGTGMGAFPSSLGFRSGGSALDRLATARGAKTGADRNRGSTLSPPRRARNMA